jgi:hypothetical protein
MVLNLFIVQIKAIIYYTNQVGLDMIEEKLLTAAAKAVYEHAAVLLQAMQDRKLQQEVMDEAKRIAESILSLGHPTAR